MRISGGAGVGERGGKGVNASNSEELAQQDSCATERGSKQALLPTLQRYTKSGLKLRVGAPLTTARATLQGSHACMHHRREEQGNSQESEGHQQAGHAGESEHVSPPAGRAREEAVYDTGHHLAHRDEKRVERHQLAADVAG